MSVTRLPIPGHAISLGLLRVPAREAHHARVARVGPGEAVEVLDLDGTVGIGRLSRWEGSACWVEVDRVERDRGEPPAPLVLGLCVLHTQAFDWAVEKATELGVSAVVPVISGLVQGGRHAARVERWRRIAAAAVAQCGRSRAPAVSEPERLADFLAGSRGMRLIADPGAAPPEWLEVGGDGITVLVGPEGGFTDEERAAILAAGFAGLLLGPRILRAETAAVAALALAQSLAGWLR
ncbi:MAG: 16S rRNA (uracil(1498)-N(3))-methyltransferase [Thermoanaerobaculaceae bacterium]|nr:16S rRNA (uracil(1498)-N(3))-methyltransferase [Thermoanaerobaculaceae bacterium]